MSESHPIVRAWNALNTTFGKIILAVLIAGCISAFSAAGGWTMARWNLPAINSSRLDRLEDRVARIVETEKEITAKLAEMDRMDATHTQAIAVINTKLDTAIQYLQRLIDKK